MSYDEHGVHEWLPGGLAVREPVEAEINGAEFTVNGTSVDGAALNGHTASDAEAERATFDLNQVNFEELIGLGLSVGQAARFISQRERRGGISELSELDGYYGLAPGVRDILRWSGRI
jgi:hypothetical protein